MKTPTAHEKYAAEVRKRHSCTPYRLGLAVALAGDNLPSPYTPGSRGDHNYLNGMEHGRTERRIDAKARALYEDSLPDGATAQAWDSMTGRQKWPWREKAIEALANPRGVEGRTK
jgi:hypothetical protein